VENEGFRKLIYELEPRYKIPSRSYFSETLIPNLYTKSKSFVLDKVKKAAHVGLTTDSWTSRSTESYVTITSTFITEDWERANYVLQTRKLCESHTGENLAIVLSDAIKEWNISDQPSLVTDNARNMGTMAAQGNYKVHFGCFAHTVNLAAQKALLVERVSCLLAKIRRIVAYFHRSTTACAVLKEKLKTQHLPDQKLIIDVCTRWNSSADMIERFLELQAGVYGALTSKDLRGKERDLSNLIDADISLAEDILICLKPMKTVPTVMCSEKHPTASMILPIYFELLSLMSYKDDDNACICELKSAVTTDLSKRYQDPEVRMFLQKASLLDPRFKSIPFLKDDEKLELYTQVTVEASNNVVVQNSSQISRSKELVLVDNDSVNSPETATQPKRSKTESGIISILGDTYNTLAPPHSPMSVIEIVEQEMAKYREEIGISLTTNPLTWWSAQRNKYPYLSKLAKVYLCVPGTSVPSERVFSTAGDIVSSQRSCLKPSCVDMLIFLKKNVH
ncbi:E3 SUMO-protein ligase ZBED1-like, partial [Patella vulgata]|uniref:E3 SUMO-protein ligase ZBED1-like n=1 Tax=Patella vulgata TaxID=6465 RepID=UPI0024A93C68